MKALKTVKTPVWNIISDSQAQLTDKHQKKVVSFFLIELISDKTVHF